MDSSAAAPVSVQALPVTNLSLKQQVLLDEIKSTLSASSWTQAQQDGVIELAKQVMLFPSVDNGAFSSLLHLLPSQIRLMEAWTEKKPKSTRPRCVPSIGSVLFLSQKVWPGKRAINCYLVAAGVKTVYFPGEFLSDGIWFLDSAGLSFSRLPSPSREAFVHRSDDIETISGIIQGASEGECLVDTLSDYDSPMRPGNIPKDEYYFVIKFFAKFESNECEVAKTRILCSDFTPSKRLEIVAEMKRYKEALAPHFEVFSRFGESDDIRQEKGVTNDKLTLGMPAGRF